MSDADPIEGGTSAESASRDSGKGREVGILETLQEQGLGFELSVARRCAEQMRLPITRVPSGLATVTRNSGCSFAVPLVSGVAALIRALEPASSAGQVEARGEWAVDPRSRIRDWESKRSARWAQPDRRRTGMRISPALSVSAAEIDEALVKLGEALEAMRCRIRRFGRDG